MWCGVNDLGGVEGGERRAVAAWGVGLRLMRLVAQPLLELDWEGLHSPGLQYAGRSAVVWVWFLAGGAVPAEELVAEAFEDLLLG